ncbi:MAG: PQQ-binding-like beta-propeller repeat protein, partial [Pirellulaceae bacterium]|nr:PQQ-binding-like beta-propeller repeat protein [Pirellulaceae bacterium]
MIGLWLLWVWQHVAGTCWADWPQWRHDANRSGATLQRCSEPLALRWMIDLGVPDPAYDHQYRMCADAATAPVAADGLIFVPSNTSDSVTAYELATGRFRWRYVTEGPVRFAPILIGQQVIFGSDDGYLHCVGSHDGRLRWRIRGAAEHVPDSRMLVNGRLASRWPVRGGPVEASGVVFFGAGIWPEEGVYVTAVTADSGTVLWRSDRMSYVREGMSDHGQAYDLGLPPHGYLAVIDGRLAVPSGRALAAWFDPNSGAMEPYTCFYVKMAPPRGTWFLSGIGQYSVQGGNWFGTRSDSLPPVPPALQTARSGLVGSRSEPEHEVQAARNRPFFDAVKYRLHNENLYPEPVLTETAIYASEFDTTSQYLVPRGHTHITYPAFDKIVARDLTRPVWKLVQEEITAYPAGTKIRRLEFPVLWELRTPLRVLIKAADRLYAGGDDTIAAISIPDDEEMPAIVWQAAVNGHPVNALVSAGCLIVSTNTGKVYCFGDAASVEADGKANIREGASETTTDKHAEPEMSPERPASVPLPRVPPHGYALCLAADAGRGLALANDYRVVLFEPDSERAMDLRQELARDGVPANRVQVVGWNSDLRVTPYWADQVSIRSLVPFGDAASSALDMALDAMRPCTGQGTLPDNEQHRQWLQSSLTSREGYEWRSDSGECTLERLAPPVGAAEWTHEAAGPGNTYSSPDRLVRWPLAALWYSGDIDRDFTPASHFQHERNPYPLVAHGRMFLIAHQMLHAVDIYTGRYLWRAEMPVTDWVAARSQDSRVYGRPVDRNYLATQDAVYVILEREIHVYSADDGSHRRVIGIPSDVQSEVADPRWTEVREQDGLLHAVVGNRLIVLDRHTGELCWQRPSTLGATTFALGDGRVFGLDFVATGPRGSRNQNPQQGTLFVLNARTGETIWSRSVQYDPVPEHEVDNPRPWLLPIDPQLAYNARHRLIVLVARRNS